MRVFVTGATGYIGGAVAMELLRAGHEVVALTRSREKARGLEARGVRAVVADVRDPVGYRSDAEAADALVHVAAAESGDERGEVDDAAVSTLLEAAAEGRPRVLVYTSGCFILGETGGEPAAEDASTENAPAGMEWRRASESRVLAADGAELATSVIRPGMVYGGREGVISGLFASAGAEGAARIVGDGENHWSPVYLGDVARLYRLAVEEGARGIFHCAEPAARVADVAAAASRAAGAGGAVVREPVDEARARLGAFADALTMDQVMAWPRAEALGWAPAHAPFVESAGAVFAEWAGGGAA